MKKLIPFLVFCFAGTSAWAQSAASPPTNLRISTPSTVQPSDGIINQSSPTLAFTNRTGQTFTASQLAIQLQALRNAVGQTLPVVTAFNESFSSGGSSTSQPLTTGISDLVSGVFKRNSSQTNQAANGQSSHGLTNITGMLRGLLNTNAASSVSADGNTAQQLLALQSQLQSMRPIVDSLTGGSGVASPSTPLSANPGFTNQLNRPLAPTGR